MHAARGIEVPSSRTFYTISNRIVTRLAITRSTSSPGAAAIDPGHISKTIDRTEKFTRALTGSRLAFYAQVEEATLPQDRRTDPHDRTFHFHSDLQ
jgi:hypothetical protein